MYGSRTSRLGDSTLGLTNAQQNSSAAIQSPGGGVSAQLYGGHVMLADGSITAAPGPFNPSAPNPFGWGASDQSASFAAAQARGDLIFLNSQGGIAGSLGTSSGVAPTPPQTLHDARTGNVVPTAVAQQQSQTGSPVAPATPVSVATAPPPVSVADIMAAAAPASADLVAGGPTIEAITTGAAPAPVDSIPISGVDYGNPGLATQAVPVPAPIPAVAPDGTPAAGLPWWLWVAAAVGGYLLVSRKGSRP